MSDTRQFALVQKRTCRISVVPKKIALQRYANDRHLQLIFPFVFDVPIEGVPKKSRLPLWGTGGGEMCHIFTDWWYFCRYYLPTDGILYTV